MNHQILFFLAFLILNGVNYINAYCTRVEEQNCESYTVTCTNGIDNLQKHCDNAPVTFVLKNFASETFNGNLFSNTDSSFDPTVTVIQGIDNNWPILESEVFHYYRNTIKVDLSGNHISVIRDSTFKGLYLLENLNLSRNSIESLPARLFFPDTGRTSSLNTLDLSSNKISSIGSSTFQRLRRLKTLCLDNNNIHSLNNDAFIDMEDLDYLSLRNNRLTSLNNLLTRTHSLKTFDISNNCLTHLNTVETVSLRFLESFNASWNAIETVDSDCFSKAFALKTLDLSCNKIKSPIESTMFIANDGLEYLNLYNNSISEIKGSAFKNTKITYLNIESNYLSGIIGEYTFAGIRSTQLNMSNYGIEIIKNYAFSNSRTLVYLNLSNNIINTIEDHGIDSVSMLSILDLSYNSLSNINFLQFCCFHLNELHLRDNKLESLPQYFPRDYISIKVLDISMNNIAFLGQNSLPLNNLQYFSVQDNLLKGVIERGVFSPSKYMKTLDLSNMNFKAIHSGAFNDMPALVSLNFSHNQISFIDPNNFLGLNNLLALDVSYNQIDTFKVNSVVLKNLKSINLSNNNFNSVSELISQCKNLTFLDASHNKIEDISSTPFELSPNLQTLYLSHNKIQTFNNQHTNKLTKLVDLKLSSNKLSYLNFSYFPQLQSLEVSNIGLKDIKGQFLQNLKNLKYLDLSSNNIADFPPGIFRETSNSIKFFNISSNKLISLRFGTLNDLHSIELLDISCNYINDLDVNLFHECISLKKIIIDNNDITKLDVDGLVRIIPNMKTISLGGNPFSCKELVQILKKFNHSSVHVTSIDVEYHDDNFHGIKCQADGKTWVNAKHIKHGENTEITNDYGHVIQDNIIEVESSQGEYAGLTAWCSILTIILIISVVTFGYYYNKHTNILEDIIKAFETILQNHRPSFL